MVAQPGTFDASFGDHGIVEAPWVGPDTDGRAVAIQSDGKIIVVASFGRGGSGGAVRFHADGSMDNTFGWWGGTSGFGSPGTIPEGVVIQPDSRIVIAGIDGESQRFLVARLHHHGVLDAGFGDGGVVTLDATPGASHAYAVAVQKDGRIVVAGEGFASPMQQDAERRMVLARFTTTGKLDTTFGVGGTVLVDPKAWPDPLNLEYASGATSVVVGPDGRIVVGGFISADAGYQHDVQQPALRRYHADGSPDTTFGHADGEVHTPIYADGDTYRGSCRRVAIRPDGGVVAVRTHPTGAGFSLARFDPDGEEVFSWVMPYRAPNDKLFDGVGPHLGMALQVDGRVVVAGTAAAGPGAASLAVVRLTADGDSDPSFGHEGCTVTTLSTRSYARDVTLQPDKKIVVVGQAGDVAWHDNLDVAALARHIVLVRYHGAGRLVPPVRIRVPPPKVRSPKPHR